MKRYALSVCMAALLLTGLSACGSGQTPAAESSAETTQAAAADTSADTAAAPAGTDSTATAGGTEAAGAETTAASAENAAPKTTEQTDAARTELRESTTSAAQSAAPEDQPLFTVTGEAAAGSDTMTVQVALTRNPGFQLLSLRLYYDEKLTPVSDGKQCEYENGSVTEGALATCPVNPDLHLIGYVVLGQSVMTGDGTLFTCSLRLPEGAKSGDSYDFSLELLDFNDGKNSLTGAAEPAQIVVQ